jgi:pimeloyl-ACP methyl ester carboxylesterase
VTSRVEIGWDQRRIGIEYRLIPGPAAAPLLVFLHEGLGSVSMWRDFPDRLCRTLGCRALVYSRPGYGRSSPHTGPLRPDFMHRQASEVLPALLDALCIDEPIVPLGHSDGGSIALLFAAHHPARVQSLVVMAPHILVEQVSIRSIAQAREAWASTDLRQRLARHHDDVEGVFRGWNDIWLHPDFAAWNIEDEIGAIRAPTLAIQGLDDEYGTLEQIRGIARRVPGTTLLELAACRHSPHRDQPEAVIEAVGKHLASL